MLSSGLQGWGRGLVLVYGVGVSVLFWLGGDCLDLAYGVG